MYVAPLRVPVAVNHVWCMVLDGGGAGGWWGYVAVKRGLVGGSANPKL